MQGEIRAHGLGQLLQSYDGSPLFRLTSPTPRRAGLRRRDAAPSLKGKCALVLSPDEDGRILTVQSFGDLQRSTADVDYARSALPLSDRCVCLWTDPGDSLPTANDERAQVRILVVEAV